MSFKIESTYRNDEIDSIYKASAVERPVYVQYTDYKNDGDF